MNDDFARILMKVMDKGRALNKLAKANDKQINVLDNCKFELSQIKLGTSAATIQNITNAISALKGLNTAIAEELKMLKGR